MAARPHRTRLVMVVRGRVGRARCSPTSSATTARRTRCTCAGVPGRAELRARAVAYLAGHRAAAARARAVFDAVLAGTGCAPGMFGTLFAAYGTGWRLTYELVFGAYALPENYNPFAINTGAGMAKSMLAFVALLRRPGAGRAAGGGRRAAGASRGRGSCVAARGRVRAGRGVAGQLHRRRRAGPARPGAAARRSPRTGEGTDRRTGAEGAHMPRSNRSVRHARGRPFPGTPAARAGSPAAVTLWTARGPGRPDGLLDAGRRRRARAGCSA